MLNPYQYSDSRDELLKRMIQHAQQNVVDGQIINILKQFFEKELSKESRAFSRPERARLFQEITKVILTDVLKRTDGAK